MISRTLTIRMFDHETLGGDRIVASTSYKKEDIIKGEYTNPKWINLYGS